MKVIYFRSLVVSFLRKGFTYSNANSISKNSFKIRTSERLKLLSFKILPQDFVFFVSTLVRLGKDVVDVASTGRVTGAEGWTGWEGLLWSHPVYSLFHKFRKNH